MAIASFPFLQIIGTAQMAGIAWLMIMGQVNAGKERHRSG